MPETLYVQFEDLGWLSPERGLALEVEALRGLSRAAAGPVPRHGSGRSRGPAPSSSDGGSLQRVSGERLLVWESDRPAVVLPRNGDPEAWAHLPACVSRGVPLLHRESGGGAVVVGPGCLNIALVLSLDTRPWLADAVYSYEWLLGRLARVLAIEGIAIRVTDLALRERKFAGHAQRRVRGALLHHGVLLYDSDDFDLDLVDALLREPLRRPAWRGNRTHREFLASVPLARDEIVCRLGGLPTALEE